jgi:AraC-like DNA-binding protein
MEQFEKIYLYKRIVKAKLFIDEHYADNIDLDNIAGQAHFSKYHFIRLFKSVYGRTPKNYLIKVRINQAMLLLANGNSVSETGLMVGLDSPTSFTGMFKKIVGKTPSAFQKKEIARRKSIMENPLQFVPNCYAETAGWIKPQF